MYLRRTQQNFILFTCLAQLVIIMTALKFFVACGLFVAVFAAGEREPVAEIITERTVVDPTGYDFEFKTSDGVSRQEKAGLITVGDRQGIAVQGSYSYPGPDGQQYLVTFTADDKGYKPQLRIVPASQ